MRHAYADKWANDVLEQIASSCNIVAKARTETDWELFLNAVYEAAQLLPQTQRAILLLSEEHGLSYADIGRVLNIPLSTVMNNLARAVDIIVDYLRNKSLIDLTTRDEAKIAGIIYSEKFHPEENNAQTRFGFYHGFTPPWFYCGTNPLMDDS